ncbi:putative quinol monooxygenase [Sphingomonas oryzagri]|jgi:quinol monooxygenase YgiN|uniref:Quinol monooxygenase n=1 Tax=Sphingomonas oryzagri TaxID=3042314 RepID=A0ABT6N464_9SPHN|nr:putative quinol monooxygenase [Sphingomonas oryzagri]MDH7639559.1 putative quinol monooxygenase [Sphingomonas oryzagri]
MPLKIVAFLTPKPGSETALRQAVAAVVAGSRAETGNLRYDAWHDAAAGRIVIDELYVDHAAIDAHREAAHYKAFRAAVADLLAAPPEVSVLNEIEVA